MKIIYEYALYQLGADQCTIWCDSYWYLICNYYWNKHIYQGDLRALVFPTTQSLLYLMTRGEPFSDLEDI